MGEYEPFGLAQFDYLKYTYGNFSSGETGITSISYGRYGHYVIRMNDLTAQIESISKKGPVIVEIEVSGLNAGDDFFSATDFTDTIYGGAGDDIIYGYGGSDWLYGGQGADNIFGGAGNDHLYGGDGDDVFFDDIGNNVIDGGSGYDSMLFDGNLADYSISYDRDNQTFVVTSPLIDVLSNTLSGVEILKFYDQTAQSVDYIPRSLVAENSSLSTIINSPLTASLPSEFVFPLGLISFEATLPESGNTEKFSLFVDDTVSVDGYYKQNTSGIWVNLARSVTYVDEKIRIDFALTDGGEFDTDGEVNGVISGSGGVGNRERPQLELRDKVLALYIAFFARAPDTEGLDFWLTAAEDGQSLYDISAGFANHPRFEQEYGGLTTREIIEKMYLNVLHRKGDEGGIDFWVDKIDSQGQEISQVFVDFTVGALEIDLEALFNDGDLTSGEYTVAFERQKILENLMQASEHFLELFGEATVPEGPPEFVAETAAYQASVAVLDTIDSDLNAVYDQRDSLMPLVGQANAMEQILDFLA